jgi:hypothetical protein
VATADNLDEDPDLSAEDDAEQDDVGLDSLDDLEVADTFDADDDHDDDDHVAVAADVPEVVVEDDEDEEIELEEDDEVEDEEEEESLDVLLARDQALDEDDLIKLDDEPRDGLATSPDPIGAGEFTCRSCFLVKRRAQLADEKKLICLDCV